MGVILLVFGVVVGVVVSPVIYHRLVVVPLVNKIVEMRYQGFQGYPPAQNEKIVLYPTVRED